MDYFPLIIALILLTLSIFAFIRHAKLRSGKKIITPKAKNSRLT